MDLTPHKPERQARRRFTLLSMMSMVAALAVALGFWVYLRRCDNPQTIAWKGWIVDLASKAEAARQRERKARVAGRIAEEAAWKARAEWFEGRLQRARISLARDEELCRNRA